MSGPTGSGDCYRAAFETLLTMSDSGIEAALDDQGERP